MRINFTSLEEQQEDHQSHPFQIDNKLPMFWNRGEEQKIFEKEINKN